MFPKFPICSPTCLESTSMYPIFFVPSFTFITYINNPKQVNYYIFILGLSQAWSIFFFDAHHNRKEIKLWGSSQLINTKYACGILACMTWKITNYNIIWTIKFCFKVMFNPTPFPHLASFLSLFSCPFWCYVENTKNSWSKHKTSTWDFEKGMNNKRN